MSVGFEELASVDGTIAPTAEATVPLKDDGLYRGDGAFEVIRLYGGKPFALVDHLDRLGRSVAVIELEFDRASLEAEIEALLAQAGPVEGQLRLIVTRGGRRIAATEPIPAHPETMNLATVTYSPTVILDGVKSLSYAANMQATRIAQRRGADEAVLKRNLAVDLLALVNTIDLSSAVDLDDFEHVGRSVLNFGLRDVAHLTS
ncbi:MAG TPA: aminotransferase class IV, partial [Solirubrobacterales bacterium]|nr:aminotransferase class IV [Solirubrobacterales bacterium]